MFEATVPYLQAAVRQCLGSPEPGAMAYVRSMPAELIHLLCRPGSIAIPGWRVLGVTDQCREELGTITADRAVQLREEKGDPVLLLVEPRRAGAGMDGIYSAVREISEEALTATALKAAGRGLQRELRDFTERAVKRASRLERLNALSGWRELLFYARCAESPESVGTLISELGLWPVDTAAGLDSNDLDMAAQIVNRLLLGPTANRSPRSRVESLLLTPESTQSAASTLEALLRKYAGESWTEVVKAAAGDRRLWLNVIRPDFGSKTLREIHLELWRKSAEDKPYAWSGLRLTESNDLELLLDKAHPEKTKLVVRWRTEPADLPQGIVDYQVSLRTLSGAELLSVAVKHARRAVQNAVFRPEDFTELEEGNAWQVKAVVHPVGHGSSDEESPLCRESEEFVVRCGEAEPEERVGVGKKARALVDEIIRGTSEAAEEARAGEVSEDKSHFIGVRVCGRTVRVFRPPVLRLVEEAWQNQGFAPGRWRLVVRPDGTSPDVPEFRPLNRDDCPEDLWRRALDESRRLGEKAMARRGFLGLVLWKDDHASAYVNAWAAVLEKGSPQLALLHTIEVRSLSNRLLGLIVLPWHPLRVAWHQAYDELAWHVRYEEKLPYADALQALKLLDGSQMPSYLPGVSPGEAFVFGDMLGFHAVAMIPRGEPEPQAVIAQLVACLAPRSDVLVPSVTISTSEAIARELDRYLDLHGAYHLLHVHALRPGDGLALVKSLDHLIEERRRPADGSDDDQSGTSRPRTAFRLRLYPSPGSAEGKTLGRYLVHCAERRRSGVQSAVDEYQWMTETVPAGSVRLPLLEWSADPGSAPIDPAHLAIGFDSFSSTLEAVGAAPFEKPRPLEAFGLIPSQVKSFRFDPVPTWEETVAMRHEGEKHPANRVLTERLLRVGEVLNRLTVRYLNGGDSDWPQLRTSLTSDEADALRRLHELSDWVVTVDRNAGIEYFDSPRDAADVYDTYVIDCVPERRDLDAVQLVTSTCQTDEVLTVLGDTLHGLQLSRSPRNAQFLLNQLKAVSGRMIMRLVGQASAQGEIIGLAMVAARCRQDEATDGPWLSLRDGFLVPLDDVRDLLFPDGRRRSADDAEGIEDGRRLRADLVYVSLGARNALCFTFVEVKFRRLLTSAMNSALWRKAFDQLRDTRVRWESTYFGDLSPTVKALRRKRLVRALRFYLERGRRRELREDVYERLSELLDRLLRSDFERTSDSLMDRGYVFCPEYQGAPAEIVSEEARQMWVFGPQGLPDNVSPTLMATPAVAGRSPQDGRDLTGKPPNLPIEPATGPAGDDVDRYREERGGSSSGTLPVSMPVGSGVPAGPGKDGGSGSSSGELILGHRMPDGAATKWGLSIQGNPHLMIVGLPGMGKTTTILSLTEQLMAAGITPIVFCYHDDIESKLENAGVDLKRVDVEHGLGFNPLRVVGSGRHSWLDNVGMLRDMFAALFPDLGDLQANEIREAIKSSYVEQGWSLPDADPAKLSPPSFQRFFDIVRGAKKPNPGIVARLTELGDYGFFAATAGESSLLTTATPTLIRLYASQNEVLQNALSSFILLSLYQNMFLRGAQPRLTHAVIFDEAHRASRLRLLPTMAKECRKYGLSLVVASQEAKDFHPSLYAAVANYLVLRVTEVDAKALARNVPSSSNGLSLAERLKELPKFHAWFCQEGGRPTYLKLRNFDV